MNITRTISDYEVIASSIEVEDGKPVIKELAKASFFGTKPSQTEARRALKEAGFTVPRGCTLVINERSAQAYACTLEQFLSVASPVAAA